MSEKRLAILLQRIATYDKEISCKLEKLQEILDQEPSDGYASESTLQDVETLLQQINTNVASDSDWEAAYVKDEGNENKIVWAVRIYNENAGTFSPVTYYEADGTTYVPTGPVSFVDNRALLVSILAEFTGNETNGADDISGDASFTLSGNVTSYTLEINQGTVDHLGVTWGEGARTWGSSLNKTLNGSLTFDASGSTDAKILWIKQ